MKLNVFCEDDYVLIIIENYDNCEIMSKIDSRILDYITLRVLWKDNKIISGAY